MKKFKRTICVLLVALMAFSLCACSADKKEESSEPESSVSSEVSGESSVNTDPTPVPEEEVEVVVVNGDGVYIRGDASTEQEPLGSADNGDTFQLVSKVDEDWYQIRYNGQDAYITTLYSEIKSIKQSAYDALFPEEPETDEDTDETDTEGENEDETDEESSGVTAEETRNSEDGER